jgi:rhamnogalacturonyl hydrolase YesR
LFDVCATDAQIMNNMYTAFMGTNPTHDCSWTRGTYMAGHMAYYETTKNADALNYAVAWGDSYGWQTCSHDTNANDECAVQAYVEVARLTNNASRIAPARATMQSQIANNDTTSWWWIDATFMALPAFVRMGNYTGETAFFDQGRKLFEETAFGKFHLWVEEDNLFLRDDTYVNKTW